VKLEIPELSLVMLVGATSSGKSTFARKHFLPTEIVSSDYCRAALADDENDQSVTAEAFDLMHTILGKRLKLGKLAVADATNVQPSARKGLIALAKAHNVFCVAIVFDLPERQIAERHATRADRQFGHHVIHNQVADLHRSMRGLEREGCRYVHVLRRQEEVDAATVQRNRLWTNLRHEAGPFDIVGDIHGCFDEMVELIRNLGYECSNESGTWNVSHPAGRRLVFVGDLVDRGPNSPEVIELVRSAVASGAAFCVAGNHDAKLARALNGRDVKVTHGLERSLEQLADKTPEYKREAAEFLDGLISHYVMDGGKLVVAHAGLSEELQGRSSGRVRSFAMYGETTGETDDFGLPVRYNWAKDYRGKAMVVYGHTPVPEAEWLNNTICVDTGCVFGGKLTALRYPERELVSVPAAREYYAPVRPLAAPGGALSAQQLADDLLDFADVSGKRYIRTSLAGTVQVREENAAAALEVMSRFAADPRWLVYLPPTMSPCETSARPGLLEHPAEALEYFASNGVARAICEEKHMGSRAVIVLCKDADAAHRRFGIADAGSGIIYTRTGRRFFSDAAFESAILQSLANGMQEAGLWDELATDWICIDCEIMPWSAKAMALIRNQYAPVGAAGEAMLARAGDIVRSASAAGVAVDGIATSVEERLAAIKRYRAAYAPYCWDVMDVSDIRIAPFHFLASERRVHIDRDHLWHLELAARLAERVPGLVMATSRRVVDLANAAEKEDAAAWWEELTAKGGEGMVVKPLEFVARGEKGLVQPAVKCRGPEYLRIIYGPEYTRAANLERLRNRGLAGKRRLAIREFALGIEGLTRFVERQPLRSVHECAFAVLALESDPVDPRL
jgi:polynucleotide kinase-phosphatase